MSDLDQEIREELHGAADGYEPNRSLSLPNVRQRARTLRGKVLVSTLIIALLLASGSFFIARAIYANQSSSLIGPGHRDPNYSVAVREMRHLVHLLNLPPGATETSTAPTEELSTGSIRVRPGSNFVSATGWWTVPASVDSTISWIVQHPPAGLLLLGSQGTMSTPKYLLHLIDFQGHGAQAYQAVTIEISVEKVLGHSAVRADAQAVWLTSTTTRDTRPEPHERVTIAGGCPTGLGGYQDIINPPNRDLESRLIPASLPVGAIRCRYHGSPVGRSAYKFVLTGVDHLDASSAQRLARAIRTLPLGSPGAVLYSGGPPPFPLSPFAIRRLATEVIVFSFPSRDDIDLWHADGYVDNGFITTVATIGSLG